MVTLTNLSFGTQGLLTDATTLYLMGSGKLSTVPLAGGTANTLYGAVTGVVKFPMLEDATHVYWADGNGARRVTKVGGTKSDVAGALPGFSGIGPTAPWDLDSGTIYFGSNSGTGGQLPKVSKVPAAGGANTLLADLSGHGMGWPVRLVVDGPTIWVGFRTPGTPGTGKLIKLAK